MLPQENLIILGVLRRILVHSEAYREAHRASWEEARHQNNHCLLSYWNPGNHFHHFHRLRSIIYTGADPGEGGGHGDKATTHGAAIKMAMCCSQVKGATGTHFISWYNLCCPYDQAYLFQVHPCLPPIQHCPIELDFHTAYGLDKPDCPTAFKSPFSFHLGCG